MRDCKLCLLTKEDGAFYASNRSACKDCVKTRVRKYRETNIESVREYDRRRFHEDPERKQYSYTRSKAYRLKEPVKYRAHSAVSNAVRDGRLTKLPCEVCGSSFAEAHHDDYTKPLDVRWLCKVHHERWHHTHG
jgi:hypothetical protein